MGRVEERLPICDECRYRVIAFDQYRKLRDFPLVRQGLAPYLSY